jgi:hypothetical protein
MRRVKFVFGLLAVFVSLLSVVACMSFLEPISAPVITSPAAPAPQPTPQSLPTITIVNNTGRTVWYVNVSRSDNQNWGDDLLASNEVLSSGSSKIITLPQPLSVASRYDLRLRDGEGNSWIKWNVQVSQGSNIVFTASDLSNTQTVSGPAITIVNNTGATIWFLNVSQTASSSWGDDLLGSSETLANGSSKTITLPYPLNVVNTYDIRLRDGGGNSWIKRNVQVSQGSRIVFTASDLSNTQTVSGPTITIVNNTGTTIWYLNVSQTASSSWGDDLLGSSETLANGSSKIITLPYPLNVVNTYDIRLRDGTGNSWIKWNVQVSQGSRIVFTASDRNLN